MNTHRVGVIVGAALLTLLSAATAHATALEPTNEAVDGAFVRVVPLSAPAMELDVRLTRATTVSSARLDYGGSGIPATAIEPYPATGDTTAILFLVDTSDPRRQPVVERIAEDIRTLMTGAPPHRQFGLARFDKDVTVIVPIGSAPDSVAAAADRLRAEGQVTQLFLSAVQALEVLEDQNAARRALVVFSDGLKEDKDYTVDHVVERARRLGIAIYGYGYARVLEESTSLQNLRLMAEGTGGGYAEVIGEASLPREALASAFEKLESGARITFDLDALRSPFFHQRGEGRVTIVTDGDPITLALALDLPRLPWQAVLREPVVLGGIGGFAAVVVIAVGWRLRRRAGVPETSAEETPEPPVHAVLEFFDSDGRTYEMRKNSIVIGRGFGAEYDNDVVLDNDTVSAIHAAIRRQRDGRYVIADLDSRNHVYVNGNRVESGDIAPGDVCELGEVRFRFVPRETGPPAEGEEPLAEEAVDMEPSLSTRVGEQ